jgi:hypothetical protein
VPFGRPFFCGGDFCGGDFTDEAFYTAIVR